MFRGHTAMSVSRKVQTGVDRYGAPTYATQDVKFRGELVPLDSDEVLAGSSMVASSYRLLAPVSAALVASDAVKVGGLAYQVQGEPGRHRLGGRLHHLEAVVKRVTG